MSELFSFGAWVRRRRRTLDLTREELAPRLGCSVVTIRRIETDVRRPSKQLAARLADCLEIAAEERPAFLKAARGELAVDRLSAPAERGIAGGAAGKAVELHLPGGTVTFLFTDIEGSTRLWECHASAMPSALARHTALLHAAIAAHNGVVFKMVGDGVCAAFASAPAALDAALAAQRALQAEEWAATGPLQVRIALHTGTASPQLGDPAAATAMETESLAISRALGDRRNTAYAQAFLGAYLTLHQDEHAEAQRLIAQALRGQHEIGDQWGMALVLWFTAIVSAAQGQATRSVRLQGASAALIEAIGAALPLTASPRFSQILQTSRQTLTDDQQARAEAEGRAMTVEQAIALVEG